MSKKVILNYEGTKFELEMNRAAVQTMEANGFRYSQLEDMPATMIPELIYGAFVMHHPNIKRSEVDEIYAATPDKSGFMSAIAGMYKDTLEALSEDPPENTSKKVMWKVSE